MNYEEKYKEALRVIESLYNVVRYQSSTDALLTFQTLEKAFPELKESEDKKTRKAILELVKQSSHILNHMNQKSMIAWLEKQGEQKPNFCHHEVDLSGCSEEYCKAYYDGWNNCNQQHSQLKAEQTLDWGEEDEKFVHGLIRGLVAKRDIHGHTTFSSDCIDITETINWLKSLKDRVQPKPKQEWSEKDTRILQNVIRSIKISRSSCEEDDDIKDGYDEELDWLKSLKPNYWKPSEEEMEALLYALGKGGTYNKEALTRLFNDIKKL